MSCSCPLELRAQTLNLSVKLERVAKCGSDRNTLDMNLFSSRLQKVINLRVTIVIEYVKICFLGCFSSCLLLYMLLE